MTTNTFVCKCCKKVQPINPKLKGQQHYCSKLSCQRARKAAWKRSKLKNDPIYAEYHRAGCKEWNREHPQYWREYRRLHPASVKRNRILQKSRNTLKRLRLSNQKIAKVDALIADKPLEIPLLYGDYWLVPLIAKVDALKVKISVFTD